MARSAPSYPEDQWILHAHARLAELAAREALVSRDRGTPPGSRYRWTGQNRRGGHDPRQTQVPARGGLPHGTRGCVLAGSGGCLTDGAEASSEIGAQGGGWDTATRYLLRNASTPYIDGAWGILQATMLALHERRLHLCCEALRVTNSRRRVQLAPCPPLPGWARLGYRALCEGVTSDPVESRRRFVKVARKWLEVAGDGAADVDWFWSQYAEAFWHSQWLHEPPCPVAFAALQVEVEMNQRRPVEMAVEPFREALSAVPTLAEFAHSAPPLALAEKAHLEYLCLRDVPVPSRRGRPAKWLSRAFYEGVRAHKRRAPTAIDMADLALVWGFEINSATRTHANTLVSRWRGNLKTWRKSPKSIRKQSQSHSRIPCQHSPR